MFFLPMFTAAKDAMASRGAQSYLNGVIAAYGKLSELRIDSKRQTVVAVCLLHGESVPLTVNVGKYSLESVGTKTFVQISQCTSNRPWAQALVRDFAEGRRWELPRWAAAAL